MSAITQDAPASTIVARVSHRMKRPPASLVYASLGLMVFIWSVNYIVAKVALRSFPPMLLGGLRTAFAGLFMIPVYAWSQMRLRTGAGQWTGRDVPRLLALGVFGIAMNQFFFVVGIERTSVAHASILSGLTPLMVLGIAAALGMERLTAIKAAGMGTALAGVAVLNLNAARGTEATIAGNAFIVLGCAAFSIFTVAGKRATAQFGGVTVNAFAYIGGGLALAPITIWQSAGFSYSSIHWSAWASVLWMAAFPAVLCYLILYWALKYLPASRVAAMSYFQPVLATTMAVPLLGERPSLSLVAGGALVLTGIFVSGRGR